MIKKNIEKEERKSTRKPPIPYSRKTLTKVGKMRKIEKKYRKIGE